MIKDTDLAYMAGYIDGDGCFFIRKSATKFLAHIIIASTDKNVLSYFKNHLGGSIASSKKIPKQKQVFYYTLGKVRSNQLTKEILPYLVERIDEATIFLAFIKSQKNSERIDLISKMKTCRESTNLVTRDLKEIYEATRGTIQPSKDDFAYLAGFIDAECCFTITRERRKDGLYCVYKAILTCNNSKAPNFKWLLERFNGRINFIDRNSKDPNLRDQFKWHISAKRLRNVIDKIHPFLKHKKPVCEEIMKFNNTVIPNGGDRQSQAYKASYASIIKERECIVHNVHFLNLKGTSI